VSEAKVRIRDLGDAEFSDRYDCDRFTASVLGNRFAYIVDHMCTKMLGSAFSPILRDFYDFAATIAGPGAIGYPMPASSNSILYFTGVMADSVRTTVEEYGLDRLEPGDVIVCNDPYRSGTHVNDLMLVRPVFEGGGIAGFVNLKAHQLDMGGTVPGGFSATKTGVYETGLVIPPRALMKRGEIVKETWSLIFDNVRFAELLLPDMQTGISILDLGERLLEETIERYGRSAVHGAMRYVCDVSAERTEMGLEELPDGTWEGEETFDCDGVGADEDFRVRVRVAKRGDRVEVDFSGSSRQARTCINATALDAKTAVGVAFKFLLDPRGGLTSGTFRPIDIVLPDQTVMSALPPEGGVFIAWEVCQVAVNALLRALAEPFGDRAIPGDSGSGDIHNAGGVRPDGTPWVAVAQCGGEVAPFGADADSDGDSNMLVYMANGLGVAIEAVESEAPVVVRRHEIVADTAGAGQNRGGAAVVRDTLWTLPAQHHFLSFRYRNAPGFGVRGGGTGATGGIWFFEGEGAEVLGESDPGDSVYGLAQPVGGVLDPETHAPSADGDYLYIYEKPSWATREGMMMRVLSNGAGGWGDPLERDPERVKRDVRDGYVTIEGAARDYGVVVSGDPDEDPESLALDLEATAKLRAERR